MVKMEINRWTGLTNYYNEMLRDGYAFKKGTEHLHHKQMDEASKIKVWDMHLNEWAKEGWTIVEEVKCENILLNKDGIQAVFKMNNWCGCVNEKETEK